MSPTKKSDDEFSEQEAKQRFEAALRGARSAGYKPLEAVKKAAAKKRAARKKSGK
jgi:hypothetical protein